MPFNSLGRKVFHSGELILGGNCLRHPNTSGRRYDVKLFKNNLIFESPEGETLIGVADIVGCEVLRRKVASSKKQSTGTKSAYFCVYAYHLRSSRSTVTLASLARHRHTYVFEVDEGGSYQRNLNIARQWQTAIHWLIRGHKFTTKSGSPHATIPRSLPAERRYLCFVNPKAGKGRSLKIFLERVKPVFTEASIKCALIITERQNHAREHVRHVKLDEWAAIVMVSGDGLLHEVYNGLMERPDADRAIEMPVGIIPGGSADGIARSICHATGEPYLKDPVLACTMSCVRGHVQPLDLCQIDVPGKPPIYSCHTIGWGIFSERDADTEKMRFIGGLRVHLWALWRVCRLRAYQGRVSYLLDRRARSIRTPVLKKATVPPGELKKHPNGSSKDGKRHLRRSSSTDSVKKSKEATNSEVEKTRHNEKKNKAKAIERIAAIFDRRKRPGVEFEKTEFEPPLKGGQVADISKPPSKKLSSKVRQSDNFPNINDPIPRSWTVEEGRFIIVHGSLVSHIASDVYFAPSASLDDGVCWLMPIKQGIKRLQLLMFLLNTDSVKRADIPNVRLLPVRAFRLENFNECSVTIDGEVIRTNTLQARVLPGKARILMQ